MLNQVASTLSRNSLSESEEANAVNIVTRWSWYQRIFQAVERDPAEHANYCIRQGQLYRHILHSLNKEDDGEEWKLCVPALEREETLRRVHDTPTVGHLEITKTLNRLARTYYWPEMFRDAAKHVKACASCCAHKPAQQVTPGQMFATPAEHPG